MGKLEELNLVSSNCAEMLEASFSGVPKQVMQRILRRQHNSKFRAEYPDELKSFAMTLQFYSARAYQYVRRTFDLALPTPRQIRAWYGGVNGEPGFTQSAFSALQARVESNAASGRETVCALMLDETAVRRHVEHVNGNYYGYVDVGSGDVDDSTPVARDALVLMVVSVNGSWKLPTGYFLVDGMSGQERANLVTESLHRLHAVGVRTVSLTRDGPSCHFAMLHSLGAKFTINDMNPSFPHPADHLLRVYVILDVCHMLKLLRNSFADGLILKISDGETIRWKYIVSSITGLPMLDVGSRMFLVCFVKITIATCTPSPLKHNCPLLITVTLLPCFIAGKYSHIVTN